jgi:hypothetical protein
MRGRAIATAFARVDRRVDLEGFDERLPAFVVTLGVDQWLRQRLASRI